MRGGYGPDSRKIVNVHDRLARDVLETSALMSSSELPPHLPQVKPCIGVDILQLCIKDIVFQQDPWKVAACGVSSLLAWTAVFRSLTKPIRAFPDLDPTCTHTCMHS